MRSQRSTAGACTGAVCASRVLRRAALALALGSPALGLKASLARRRGGTSGTAALWSGERFREALTQASQSQLPVACLGSLVLCDRHHPRPYARKHQIALCVAQRGRGEHVKARFYPGSGDVGVLSPRAGGAGCADCHLRELDRQLAGDPQQSTGAFFGLAQRSRPRLDIALSAGRCLCAPRRARARARRALSRTAHASRAATGWRAPRGRALAAPRPRSLPVPSRRSSMPGARWR